MTSFDKIKYVSSPSDIPKTEHYAIFESRSVYIPGDERSRTNPGHGYPASTEYFINYIAFLDEDSLMDYLKRKDSTERKTLRVAKVKILEIEE